LPDVLLLQFVPARFVIIVCLQMGSRDIAIISEISQCGVFPFERVSPFVEINVIECDTGCDFKESRLNFFLLVPRHYWHLICPKKQEALALSLAQQGLVNVKSVPKMP